LRKLEARMGVNEKTWKAGEFTLEHVDFLNRSPYNAEWRGEISRIFSHLDPVLDEEIARTGRRRVTIVLSPSELPVGPDRLWTRLAAHGRRVPLAAVEPAEFLPQLLGGGPLLKAGGPYDTWIIEAGRSLAPFAAGALWLSYTALASCRARLMAEVRK